MSEEMSGQNQSHGKKGGSANVAIIVLIVIVFALASVVAVLLLRKPKEEEKRNVVVTKDNVEEVIEQMTTAESVAPGYYTVTMTNVWHFAMGTAISEDAYVENLTENSNDVYFDICLAEDEENIIYKSPVIPRGGVLENIALDTTLEAGTYDCVMIYHLVDDEQNTLSTLRVGMTIVIGG
jgi:hypothetical protein